MTPVYTLPVFKKPISKDPIAVAAVAVQTAEFIGTGLNDATSAGTASGVGTVNEVEITAAGTPDVFKWRQNGGAYTTGVSITGAAQTLGGGATITFAATTGHTVGDRWVIRVCGNQVALKHCVIQILSLVNIDSGNTCNFTAINAKDGKQIVNFNTIPASGDVLTNFGAGIESQGLLITAQQAGDLILNVTGGVSGGQNVIN